MNKEPLRPSTPFMSENHPLNPYGSNYIEHPYETKIFYKFNQVKKFVHLEEEDQKRIEVYSMIYFGGIAASVLFPIVAFVGCKRWLLKPDWKHFEHAAYYGHYYLGLACGLGATASYSYLQTKYIEEVARPFLFKYIDKAVENGFKDYEISQK